MKLSSLASGGLLFAAAALLSSSVHAENPNQALYQELLRADYVVKGTVVSVGEIPNLSKLPIHFPISEHSPIWKEGVIEVSGVAKGNPGATVVARFNDSYDVANRTDPKLKVGDQAVFILLPDTLTSLDGAVPTAIDVQPSQSFDLIEQLISG